MRFSTACVAAATLSAGLASARGGWLGGFSSSQDVSASDAEKVPGDSPLELCDMDHSNDLVKIDSVDLFPNPPAAGEILSIKASGTVVETIEDGATVNLVVKYGLIRLVNTKADLCKQIKNVDMECPIEKGDVSITKEVEIPKEVPPGKYNVYAEVVSKDNKPITCLQATVTFGGSKREVVNDL
ncbi:Uu.00g017490.m01.CDS01 [Anthostomella pinea]|uniref:Phosphatidylglycerol/phosphatidylinositol transfer protein n=1 Tax=Anthostomella pinea TaxID=933095 RepID=A0AAI8VZH3_9PEZI|nr:Uu.00g017490.m01.CDS01 [Anthostomella pinea]